MGFGRWGRGNEGILTNSSTDGLLIVVFRAANAADLSQSESRLCGFFDNFGNRRARAANWRRAAPGEERAARRKCHSAQIIHKDSPCRAHRCVAGAHSARIATLTARVRVPVGTCCREMTCGGISEKNARIELWTPGADSALDRNRK